MSAALATELVRNIKYMDNIHKLVLHSGNVVNKSSVSHRGLAPIDETAEALNEALEYYTDHSEKLELSYDGSIHFDWSRFLNPFDESERSYLQITQKVFLYSLDGSMIVDAVHNLIAYFKTDKIDNLIVSIPHSQIDQITESKDLTMFYRLWKHVEDLIEEGTVVNAGLTDTPLDILKQLFAFITHKPNLLQFDSSLCCKVPVDLKNFTLEHGIKLLVSREPNEMLSNINFNALMNKHFNEPLNSWKLDWLMRYTVLNERHSVIRNKGYATRATRNC